VRAMSASLELFGQRRDGSEFPLEVSLSPVEDVGRTLVAAAIRDVSDRKEVEAELTVAREAIEAMREMAERANADKTRMLRAGHDLRRPLQTVELLNAALRRIVGDPAAVDALSQQAQAIGALSRVLDALLNDPEPVDKH
jgi:PAS domain-containing protein